MSVSGTIGYDYADGSANTIRRDGCVYPNGRNVSYLYHSPGDDQLSRVSAIADGTLLQGLMSYWPLNESVSSGDRDDAQDGNTLDDTNNNVSHDTGKPSIRRPTSPEARARKHLRRRRAII
ncbi:MAG TPA: hypothetical protein VFE24_10130 [Pirellulales bacterium]|jgi:hypothetical protein|nr:hypothetical protein [Pirellulales bacterium]